MFCNQCGFQNPDASRFCGKCGTPLAAGTEAGSALAPLQASAIQFPDVTASVPEAFRKKLLPGEVAYSYLRAPQGCGSPAATLLVTDGRVLLDGVKRNPEAGCGGGTKSLEIPIAHISGVSEEKVPGCGGGKGLGIASGGATERVLVKRPKELDGAIQIIRALIRAANKR